MAEYPFGEESRPAQAYVPNNATYVCNLNLQIRNDAVYRTLWGQTDFAMGTTWGGDAYVLDTTPNDSPVCRLSQESLIVTTVATTLDSWFSELVNC